MFMQFFSKQLREAIFKNICEGPLLVFCWPKFYKRSPELDYAIRKTGKIVAILEALSHA